MMHKILNEDHQLPFVLSISELWSKHSGIHEPDSVEYLIWEILPYGSFKKVAPVAPEFA